MEQNCSASLNSMCNLNKEKKDVKALKQKKNKGGCPYTSANPLSKATIWWMNTYFQKGYKKKLVASDLYKIDEDDKSSSVTKKLSRNWDEECRNAAIKRRKPSFRHAFWKTYRWQFMLNGIIMVVSEGVRATNPIFLGELTNYFLDPKSSPIWYPYLCATALTLSSFLYILTDTMLLMRLQLLGWNARSAVVGLMYEKTLKLNNKALTETTNGKIVNLSSTDALRYDLSFIVAHNVWIAPLECAVLTYVLWLHLGTSALIAMLVLVFVMVIQTLMGKAFGKLRLQIAEITDERVQASNELIAGMRIVKMYSWEKSFQELIDNLRSKEMSRVLVASLLRAVNYTSNHSTALLLSFTTFVSLVLLQGDLDLHTVVVSLGFFTILLLGAGLCFPWSIENLFQTLTTIKRTEEFLLLPELAPSKIDNEKEPGVRLENLSASWTEASATLRDISLDVKKGELLMLIGPVGAGKSSVLSTILGELPASSGSIHVGGNVAYTSQIPWLFSDTVRNNILFGEEFDLHRYQKVVKACALDKDFSILPSGDETLVGERGITLSGGQKARVSLARMAYRSSIDVAVMDDPLSAVDASVASHLFEKCVCGFLRKKVRVLVTHQLQFLEKADKIIILKEGRVVDYGTYKELLRKKTDFASLMHNPKDEKDGDAADAGRLSESNSYFQRSFSNTDSHISSYEMEIGDLAVYEGGEGDVDHTVLIKQPKEKLYSESNQKDDDHVDPSSIPWRVYRDYFSAHIHWLLIIILVIVVIGSHSLFILTDWWLARWAQVSGKHSQSLRKLNTSVVFSTEISRENVTTTSSLNKTANSIFHEPFDHYYYLYIYTAFTIGYFVSMYVRSAIHFYVCVRSSVNLHTKMLASILKAKIRFFDTNPIGAVLNRFSKDMNQVDELLPITLLDVFFDLGVVLSIVIFVMTINYFVAIVVIPLFMYVLWIRKYFVTTSREIKRIEGLSVICSIVIFVMTVNYFIVIIVIPLAIYAVWIRKYFVSTSREIKRIEGENRSPVFSHLSASLQGLVTIRTFQVQKTFTQMYHKLQDIHGAAWSAHFFGNRWVAYRLDLATSIFIGSCAYLGVLLVSVVPEDWPINAGNLGLTLTYSTSLLIWFQWGIRQSAEAENMMTSVERIHEYHHLPEETKVKNVEKKPPPNWPQEGAISFSDLSYAYFEDGPLVLKNININIRSNEKLGIVGRTGAGKSSIVASIFRMSDQIFGSIKIDGFDANEVDLYRWRNALTIIPQDPVLFGGTMRRNLDPFSFYTDSQLWNALEKVHLKEVVESFPMKLEVKLAESGSNLSVGQRQLVCLARAILRDNKILIIDEATANVDSRTDRLIQETIRKEFQDCTVLTIAHRLDTIIDSDRILVLDNGGIQECDKPHVLLEDDESAFSEFVRMTGSREKELRSMAKAAYLLKLDEKSAVNEEERKVENNNEWAEEELNVDESTSLTSP